MKTKNIQTQAEATEIINDLHSYDKYIVCFSGGKDSVALFLHLLDQGVDQNKIELWHHDIDGSLKEGEANFMDWPITKGYVDAFAEEFNVPVFYSWRDGGFKREMLRDNQTTGDIYFEDENKNVICKPSRTGERYENTRLKFPQTSADLSVRWCSSYLKIDVCCSAIRNQSRFKGIRTLVLTGERGEESSKRATYNIIEPDKTNVISRTVDHYRPIRDWKESEVWAIMQRYGVQPHPAYQMGFGRVSCMKCIFGSANQFASVFYIDPEGTKEVARYEREFGVTIKKGVTVEDQISKGERYEAITPELKEISMNKKYNQKIRINVSDWRFPAGAFGESCGPQ